MMRLLSERGVGRPLGSTRAGLAAAVSLAACAAGAGLAADLSAAQAPGAPNIVVIMSDDQTAESMRVMQHTRSELADQGASFTDSYVNLPLCCPSRATFLTGLYAHNHDVTTNGWPLGGFEKFDLDHSQSNLATWLSDGGYHTAMVGKYMNEYGDRDPTEVPAGWAEWQAALSPDPQAYDYDLNENGTVVHYGTAAADYKGDVLTAKAVETIDRRAPSSQPFFLWLSYTAPHTGGPNPSPQAPSDCDNAAKPAPRHASAFDAEPLPQPPSFNEADVSDKPPSIQALPSFDSARIEDLTRRYRCGLESLLSVDEGVRDVVAAVKQSGELDNTLILFTSDNGFFNGEHRLIGGKGRHYEPATRVPLLIRGPGVPPGVSEDQPVINADLAPTILDAAGIASPVQPDGVSLLPLLGGSSLAREELLIENRSYAAVRNDRYVYVEYSAGPDEGATELYDLAMDPDQLQNLHGDPAYAALEAQLAQRLAALMTCAGSTCHPTAPEPGPPPVEPDAAPPTGLGTSGLADTDPPETKITRHPPKRGTDRTVKFRFTSDEPGSRFECRIDEKAFKPCDSARAERLRVAGGRHRFRVRATDAAGNTDPTPARDRFKVRRHLPAERVK